MDLGVPRPPAHVLAEKIQQDTADKREADCHGHEQHEGRDEAVFDGPVVDEVRHAELFRIEICGLVMKPF